MIQRLESILRIAKHGLFAREEIIKILVLVTQKLQQMAREASGSP
jgi:hypothetical protein